ncbi:MAG: multiheme c-type cytochrome [Pirellulaceae bacterium]
MDRPACLRCCLAAGLLAGVSACDSPEARSGGRPLKIVISGDTAGWIVPCGCTSNQSGGFLRRGTYLRQLRAGAEVVYVDVGGAASGSSPYDRVKFEAILRGELALDVVAHNIGASEAALGVDDLRSMQRTLGIPWLSCNVRDAAGKLVGDSVRIVDSPRGSVAFLGVLSESYATAALRIDPPREAILKTVAAFERQPDVLVVLAYLPTSELQNLADSLPEADVVIGGPTGQSIVPRVVGPTLLASATNKGKYLCELAAPSTLRGGRWSGTIVEMNDKFGDDPRQQDNLQHFLATLKIRDFAASQTSFASDLQYPDGYRVAGTYRCRECHADDCLLWDESRHAHAWRTLAASGAEIDSYCQSCHTTSYGVPGGFVSNARSVDRRDVGCESCHGASFAHCEDPEVQTPCFGRAQDQCQRCHDRENSPRFTYDAYWQKIVHGTDELPAADRSADGAPGNSEGGP